MDRILAGHHIDDDAQKQQRADRAMHDDLPNRCSFDQANANSDADQHNPARRTEMTARLVVIFNTPFQNKISTADRRTTSNSGGRTDRFTLDLRHRLSSSA